MISNFLPLQSVTLFNNDRKEYIIFHIQSLLIV